MQSISGETLEFLIKLGIASVTSIFGARKAHPEAVAPELDDAAFEAKFKALDDAQRQTSGHVADRIDTGNQGS